MSHLIIFWRHLHDDVLDVEEYKKLFYNKSLEELTQSAKELCIVDGPKHNPQEYRTIISETPAGCIKFYTRERSVGLPFQVIYKGTANDYLDFLISLNVMLCLLTTSREKYSFIISLYSNLKYVNEKAAARFAADIGNELYFSMK
ncbi:hypothetical protein [Domibacillus mangrovi]|uniref:Uncharacterized protein n=1 Tax=Domibacillus mangrovi TaxID=1714354 RepID=A0A1Q5P3U3_9BACI|nr:hypothetical protein [Domibacillus mangrovi]OKL36841.1 hypothetical protein BLL40_08945 [Domibacillus mangrovi]